MDHDPLRHAQDQPSACQQAASGNADTQAAILNALAAHVALIDPAGVILAVNGSWQRFAAANFLEGSESGVGQNYLDVCERALGGEAGQARAAAAGIRQVLCGEVTEFSLEYPCHAPAEQRWYNLTVTPIARERLAGAVVMHVNVTARKAVEATAFELAAQLVDTLESLTDGCFTLDRDWRFTYVNHQAERMFRRPRAELLGRNIWEQFPEARGTIIHLEYERAMREQVVVEFETFYTPLNSWFEARAFPTRQGLAVYFRDIGAARRGDESLRISEERFRLLAKATNDAIWDWDLVTNAVWWSDGFANLFGYQPDEMDPTITSWTERIHPEDVQRVVDGIHCVIEGDGNSWVEEYRFRRHDGSHAPVLDRGHIIRNSEGKGLRMIGGMSDLTERRRAEEALRESDERFAGAFAHAPIGMTLASLTGQLLKVNRAFCELIGYSEAELLTLNFRDITYPDDFASSRDNMRRVIAGQDHSFQIEKRYVHRDGHLVTTLLSVSLVHDRQGEPLSLIAQIQDITSHREADAAMRFNEERYRTLVEANAAIVWHTSASGEFEVDQPRWTAFTGQRFEQLRGHGWLHAVHPADRDETARVWTAALAAGSIYEVEHRLQTPDRGYRHMAARAVPILAEDGTIRQWAGVHSDVTEAKLAAAALRASMEEFQALAEAMPQIVWITRPDGTNIYFNQRWLDYTGLTFEESLVQSVRTQFHPEDRARARIAWHQANATTDTYSLECRLRRADGVYRWWLIRGVPQRDATGQVVKWFGTCTDIHDLKLAELEISRTNRALQAEVAERTRAEEAAEAANRSKSEFLANMSHEIRTPMNGVLGMTELALGTDLNSEQRDYLELVKSSGESLLTVINDILDFSKIEAGKLTLEIIPFDLGDCLTTALKLLANQAASKGLELAYDINPDVPTALLGDPGRLRQIVTNLIANAIKFTARGEVVLRVEAEAQTDGDARLRFSVSDTGIGVPPEQQAMIFSPFVQADGSTTRKYGGTGLGLAISSNLVSLLGGRIWLDSLPGQGSTFYFTVPFNLQPAPTAAMKITAAQLLRLRDMAVLVVDDNAVNRRILEATLTRWQMKPVLVPGGHAGVAAMQRHKRAGTTFPLVVLDAQMPEMDGFSVAEEIKRDPELAGATIMMLTSAGQRGDGARCRALGISAYLVKPISQPELLDAILAVLGMPSDGPDRQHVVTRHSLREGRSQLRVLLAEDNRVNQLVAARLLGKRGHTVVIVENGRQVLAALADRTAGGFDLILMDVQMPDMDGFEATGIIRAGEKHSGTHLPIIAMTANAMKGDEERCLIAGMDGYVSKPIQVEQLFATIARVLLPRAWTEQPLSPDV